MSGGYGYRKSTNPFEEDEDVDDETFLKNSRIKSTTTNSSFDEQIQSFQEKKKAIEDRTINSTERSISVLRDSEQIGIATAEELMRQREKLERTDKQLDEINSTLHFSQKHINGIKSVFSSLKNYVSGRGESSPIANKQNSAVFNNVQEEKESDTVKGQTNNFDRFSNQPSTRLKETNYEAPSQGYSKDFSAKLDANLQEMSTNISRLKGLAADMSYELDSQNDLISNITDKTESADIAIKRQNKEMSKLLKK